MSDSIRPYNSYLEHLEELMSLIPTYLEIYINGLKNAEFDPQPSLEHLKQSWTSILDKETVHADSSAFPILMLKKAFSLSFFEYLTVLLALSSEWSEQLCPIYEQICGAPVPSFHLARCFYHYTEPLEESPFESADLKHSALRYLLVSDFSMEMSSMEMSSMKMPSLMRQSLYLQSHILTFLTTGVIYLKDAYCDLYADFTPSKLLPLHQTARLQLIRYVKENHGTSQQQLIYLYGPEGVGKRTLIQSACASLESSLLSIDLETLKSLPIELLDTYCKEICFKLLMSESEVCLYHLTESSRELAAALINAILPFSSLIFICSIYPSGTFFFSSCSTPLFTIPLAVPSVEERFAMWSYLASRYSLNLDLKACAAKYTFTIGRLTSLLKDCQLLAEYTGQKQITQALLTESILAGQKTSLYAQLVKSPYQFDNLILEESTLIQLHQITNWVTQAYTVFHSWGYNEQLSYGRGLCILFYGPPGTGKTMAASVLANTLGLNLYKVNLSQIADKYIGETEKKLDELFNLAESANFILFFDEADSLFSKRTEVESSHDKYANIETSYLLQKMEEYEGIVILSTNLIQNLDEAFKRRLQFIIRFNMPTPQLRKKLWQSAFPLKAPLDASVDLEQLSLKYELSPSAIKSIALHSAFLAAAQSSLICQSHILQCIKSEYEKSGRLVPPL